MSNHWTKKPCLEPCCYCCCYFLFLLLKKAKVWKKKRINKKINKYNLYLWLDLEYGRLQHLIQESRGEGGWWYNSYGHHTTVTGQSSARMYYLGQPTSRWHAQPASLEAEGNVRQAREKNKGSLSRGKGRLFPLWLFLRTLPIFFAHLCPTTVKPA